ncbi:GDSL-type esterase/lipase family protein [Nocardia gamkensis]|uniref:GDSL-type esterase/lipase family protein n=1 Tax=Nocardia gamkensis TaxID=352869 RepID=UPI0033CCD4F5
MKTFHVQSGWRGLLMATAILSAHALDAGAGHAETSKGCDAPHWVGAWSAGPSDAVGLADPSVVPQIFVGNQSYRVVVTPHWGGSTVRLHFTNRFRAVPMTFGGVTIGSQSVAGAVEAGTMHSVTFDGHPGVTIPPGGDIVSDPFDFPVAEWQPVSITIYTPDLALLPTEHFVGNTTTYYSAPGSGDHTGDPTDAAFELRTTAVPLAAGLDVLAPSQVSSVVAVGDSITDGYVASNYSGIPQQPAVVDTGGRYTDFLQHRLDAAGRRMSVLNAGISGGRLLADGFIPQFGPSILARLQQDVLDRAGVSNVIVLAGINDLGIPIGADHEQLIVGYTSLIKRLKDAGVNVLLGTILPASNALFAGITAPLADSVRSRLNEWIRSQTLADGIVDFAAALQDPANPEVLDPRFAGPDNLHPNIQGYRRMAEAIDLAALRGTNCR